MNIFASFFIAFIAIIVGILCYCFDNTNFWYKLGAIISIVGVLLMIFNICATVIMHNNRQISSTRSYPIYISGDTYYYSNEIEMMKGTLNKSSYKLSNKGYSYYEITEYNSSWLFLVNEEVEESIYLSEEDIEYTYYN